MYQLKPFPIYDGAVRMKKNMYKKNTYHCLSFHIRKHIPIGKGGMILTDDKKAYDWFRTVRYEGRTMSEDGINYNATIYKDPIFGGWEAKPEEVEIFTKQFNNKSSYNIDLPSGGGQAIRFSPIKLVSMWNIVVGVDSNNKYKFIFLSKEIYEIITIIFIYNF